MPPSLTALKIDSLQEAYRIPIAASGLCWLECALVAELPADARRVRKESARNAVQFALDQCQLDLETTQLKAYSVHVLQTLSQKEPMLSTVHGQDACLKFRHSVENSWIADHGCLKILSDILGCEIHLYEQSSLTVIAPSQPTASLAKRPFCLEQVVLFDGAGQGKEHFMFL